MFIDVSDIKVDGIDFGQYLLSCEYQYNKLWGSDSGRNMRGDQSGTLLGVYPKLVMTFRRLSQSELEEIAPILDSASQKVTYRDPQKGLTTITTYTGDWSINYLGINTNESFQVSFIARSHR